MNLQPLVSIIIPVYNVEKYLRQCLDSVVNQTYNNFEIIIVNDGTKDNSQQIIDEFVNNDSRIKGVFQKNQGLSGARNTGISVATGEYIMFVDSDDWLNLQTIEFCIDAIQKTNADVVLFSYFKEYQNHSESNFILPENYFFDATECQKLHQRIIGLNGPDLCNPANADSLVTAWGKLYKTEIITQNNLQFTDCKLIGTEDMWFNAQYFLHIKSAIYSNKCLYHYRKINTSSLTSNYKVNLPKQWNYLYDLVENLLVENKLNSNYHAAFQNRISLSLIGLGLNEMSSNNSFLLKFKNINIIISNKKYKLAIQQFPLNYLPLHWKLFFLCAKYQFTFGVFIFLKLIQFILNKKQSK